MSRSTVKAIDTIEILITFDELKAILIESATKEITKGHMPGNFKPVLLIPDGYKGYKITFLKIDDKKFAEVEPLDF
jgi:hypothetical protein